MDNFGWQPREAALLQDSLSRECDGARRRDNVLMVPGTQVEVKFESDWHPAIILQGRRSDHPSRKTEYDIIFKEDGARLDRFPIRPGEEAKIREQEPPLGPIAEGVLESLLKAKTDDAALAAISFSVQQNSPKRKRKAKGSISEPASKHVIMSKKQLISAVLSLGKTDAYDVAMKVLAKMRPHISEAPALTPAQLEAVRTLADM